MNWQTKSGVLEYTHHLLVIMVDNNSLESLNFKLLPPPVNLPKYAKNQMAQASFFAQTNFAQGLYRYKDVFGIKREDRKRHMYIVGKSGMGKSKLLENLIRFDVSYGFGLAVIDPHGDLVKQILEFIPEKRLNDVVYVNPGDTECAISFNPFAQVPAEYRQIVAQGLVEIFKKQFASTWTPRIEHLFRFATLATLENPDGTLYGFLQLLTDPHYRQQAMKHVTDEVVKRFFTVEFAGFTQKYDQEAITPLTNRLGQFFADPLLRAVFSQKESKIDFEEIMNQKKILLINASKGTLGEENSALFATFFLTKINQTAMARSKIPEKERKSFYLYVDEFQNVATKSFTSLFSESRKYGINITVANQYLAQIPEDLQEAIFGNVGTLIAFRVSGADSERLSQEFQPLVEPKDLTNIGGREFYIKMSVEGKVTTAFSATTLDVIEVNRPERISQVIEESRKRFSRPIAEVLALEMNDEAEDEDDEDLEDEEETKEEADPFMPSSDGDADKKDKLEDILPPI